MGSHAAACVCDPCWSRKVAALGRQLGARTLAVAIAAVDQELDDPFGPRPPRHQAVERRAAAAAAEICVADEAENHEPAPEVAPAAMVAPAEIAPEICAPPVPPIVPAMSPPPREDIARTKRPRRRASGVGPVNPVRPPTYTPTDEARRRAAEAIAARRAAAAAAAAPLLDAAPAAPPTPIAAVPPAIRSTFTFDPTEELPDA